MTACELKKRYRGLKLNLNALNFQYENECAVAAVKLDGLPHGSGISDPTYYAKLKTDELAEKIAFVHSRMRKIEKFIDSIEDEELQGYFRDYVVNDKSFDDIGLSAHRDRTTVSKAMNAYLKEMEE